MQQVTRYLIDVSNSLLPEERILLFKDSDLVLQDGEGIGRLFGQLCSAGQLLVLCNQLPQVLNRLVQDSSLAVHVLWSELVCVCADIC